MDEAKITNFSSLVIPPACVPEIEARIVVVMVKRPQSTIVFYAQAEVSEIACDSGLIKTPIVGDPRSAAVPSTV
jgi:hypothetical protein